MKPSGSVCWVSAKGHVYYDEDSRPSRFPGVVIDITERKHTDERLKLMIHELNHRVKNTLATVQSLARQSFRKGVDADTEAAFEARLPALSKAHNLLTRENWEGAELTEVATAAAAPYCRSHGDGERLSIDGPPL
ncbi:HWE histidine kinase domain-containing protein [Microvirga sp. Mcv34]|uniref:HWE histidine kinase domain-containing protein n=1 Tax=Microvirga sp. Mcv34 TaxID=2926016 RepID=UPI0021C6AE61|nr:HWE histidine kinase domain-containing protein [Microvirga sp. Mcv34]